MKRTVEERIRKIAEGEAFSENPCFYFYDAGDIREKLEILGRRPKNVKFYYAMKANSNPDIMRLISSSGKADGIEIASVGELEKALEVAPASGIIYTGPGKTPYELRRAAEAGIRLFNMESPVEARRLSQIAQEMGKPSVDALVRINTDFYIDEAITHMAGESTKMGVEEKKLAEALAKIGQNGNINVRGFHVFAASGVLNSESLLEYADYVFGLMKRIEKETGKRPEIVDFGGGFGIDYSGEGTQFRAEDYFQGLDERIRKGGFSDREMILELGRYVVGESGNYVTEILDIKESKGKKHIVAGGGVNHLRLPSASGVNQPVHILPRNRPDIVEDQPEVYDEVVDIGGPLCFTEDKLARDVRIPRARIGDLLVVSQAGAYGKDVSSLELLSHPKPPEYLVG